MLDDGVRKLNKKIICLIAGVRKMELLDLMFVKYKNRIKTMVSNFYLCIFYFGSYFAFT